VPWIEISARIIRWPPLCACCCRVADTSIEVSHTRSSGVKVVRHQTKSWDIPYCAKCFDHIDAARALWRFRRTVLHLPVVFRLSASALSIVVILFLTRIPLLPALVLGGGWSVAVAVALYLLDPVCVRVHKLWLREREEAWRKLKRRLDTLLCGQCAEEGVLAARYHGWSGTVHTFEFSSDQYAELFRKANPRKVLL